MKIPRMLMFGMLGSLAVVLAWAWFVGWRKWPEYRTVRELKRAVEGNKPKRFLDAIEAVDKLNVAEAACDEIAPLRHHTDPRVRMYAVMAHTVLRSRAPSEARELIALFDDPDEDIEVRCTAAYCLILFDEPARKAVPALRKAMNVNDPRHRSALVAFCQLGRDVTGPSPPLNYSFPFLRTNPLRPNATRREMTQLLLDDAGAVRLADDFFGRNLPVNAPLPVGQGSP